MTTTRTPDGAPARQGPDPGHRTSGPRIAGFSVAITTGGFILTLLALGTVDPSGTWRCCQRKPVSKDICNSR